MYVINSSIWDFLKNAYTSFVMLRKEASGRIMASIQMDDKDGTYTPVALTNQSSVKPIAMIMPKEETQQSEMDKMKDDLEKDLDDMDQEPAEGRRSTIRRKELNQSIDGQRSPKDVILEEDNEESVSENKQKESLSRESKPRESAPRESAPRESVPRDSMPRDTIFRPSVLNRGSIDDEQEDLWIGTNIAPAVGLKNYGANCYVNAGQIGRAHV